MTVVFFGAGASKHAGYPVASELLQALEHEARESPSVDFTDSWGRFERFRRKVPAFLARLLRLPDTELMLTVIDTIAMAYYEDIDYWFERCRGLGSPPARGDLEALEEDLDAEEQALFLGALQARNGLLSCLDSFFSRRSYLDSEENARAARRPLERLLGQLSPGDVVLTTNWDTLAERTLGNLGL